MVNNSIDPFIHRKVVVLESTASVYEAARAMCEHDIGSIVVADNQGHIVGIVTDRTLVCELIAAGVIPEVPLEKIMTRQPVCVGESATLEEAVLLMKKNGIRRVPVIRKTVKGAQKCVGLISLDDLIANQAVSLDDLSEVVRSQILRRKNILRTVREETRGDQALETFTEAIKQSLNLDSEKTTRFIDLVLGLLVSRLHATGAGHLISRLPTPLQKKLLALPSGPDRNLTSKTILDRVIGSFFVDETEARSRIMTFWQVLTTGMGKDHANHVFHQLPSDIQELLLGNRRSAQLQKAADQN